MRGSRDIVLGIDFGTSNVSAGALLNGKVELVLDRGDPAIPSVVYVPDSGAPLVGRAAAEAGRRDPARCLRSIKRLLGRRCDEPAARLMESGFGYKLSAGPDQLPLVVTGKNTFAPTQIAGFLFQRLRELAQQRFGGRVERAVVTVPADATSAYVRAIRQAARFAHLEVEQVVAEPVAGALALGMHHEVGDRRFAVCDFGGGTFDATLIEQDEGKFRILSLAGDSLLGGDDFDSALAEGVAGFVYKSSRYDMHRDVVRWRELLWFCEAVKRKLSSSEVAPLNMRNAYVSGGAAHDLRVELERAWVEPRWKLLMERTLHVLKELMSGRHSTTEEPIARVLLIGGTSQIPLVQRTIMSYFDRPCRRSKHAELAVVVGAALQTSPQAPVATHVPALAS